MDHLEKKKVSKYFAPIIIHGQIFSVSVVKEMQKWSKCNKKDQTPHNTEYVYDFK